MRRQCATAIAVTVTSLLCTGCQPKPPSPPAPGSFINVGIKTYQYGLDYWTPGDDSPEGFEWSMLNSIFGQLGYGIRPVPITSANWEQKLDSGEISMAIGSISDTPERASKYLLTGPYMSGDLTVLSLKSKNVKVSPDNQLQGQSVCFVESPQNEEPTTAQQEIASLYKPGEFSKVPRTSTQGCLDALQEGVATVFFSDAIILRGIAVHNSSLFTVDDLNDQFGEPQTYVIAFQETPVMSALCQRVDQVLKTYLGTDQDSEWWTTFVADLGGTEDEQLALESAYKPDPSEINKQWCSTANSG